MPIAEAEKRVATARAELERATAAHAREVGRLSQTQGEVAKLTETVRSAEPDAEAPFSKLVAQRDAARGRAEALAARVEKASTSLEVARAELAGAERALEEARMAELDGRRLELERAIAADVARFRNELVARVAEVLQCVEEANAIERRLGIDRNPVLLPQQPVGEGAAVERRPRLRGRHAARPSPARWGTSSRAGRPGSRASSTLPAPGAVTR